jgi:hypothetical protein
MVSLPIPEKLVRDVPDDYFRRPALRRLLRQISQCFDVKHGANHRHKEMIESDRFICPDGLKERLIK